MDWRKFSSILPVALILSLFVTACGQEARDSKMTQRSYGNDGYMGISNSNPNHPLSPGYHSYTKDAVMMRKALAENDDIRYATLHLNGPDVYVKITPKRKLTRAETDRLLRTTEKRLAKMMPRYRIHVGL
ncbi:MAG TPA: hypothetical protein VF260_00010 [Bacilli bacterium]